MNRHFAWLLFGLMLALGAAACGDDTSADAPGDPATTTTTPNADTACPVGTFGCACDVGQTCGVGLACADGLCGRAEPECPTGQLGCACFSNQTCEDGLSCGAERLCETPAECTPGSVGCPCDEAGACDAADVFCDTTLGLCQRVDCPAGEEGCACGPQQRCGVSADGERLTCEAGECRSSGCVPGAGGCVCRGGAACDAPTDACVEGFCMSDTCVAGQEGCLCAGGTCGAGLRCQDDTVCVDNTGFLQGACREDGSCARGHRCERDACVACTLGSQGCQCRDNATCNDGLECADDGMCVNSSGLAQEAPEELLCFTPCSQGVELEDGRFVACPADGLMRGCFGDTTCVEGQCVAPDAAPAACSSESDCPDFQTCLVGRCASNCATSAECVEGAVCHRRVCRQTCTVADEEGACGPQSYCELLDGDNGVCRASVPVLDDSGAEIVAPFSVSADAVSLNNGNGVGEVVITNRSPQATEFTIRRRSHLAFEGDGSRQEVLFEDGCQAPSCPMWWLETRLDGGPVNTAPVSTFTVGGGQSVTLTLDEGDGIAQPRWQGALEISTEAGGVRTVVVTRNAAPTGQWAGEAYYFGNFKDTGIEDWVGAKDSAAAVEEVENAFVRLWANFRQGRLSFEQFQAGLIATRTESWRSPRLYELGCDDGSVCYPFTNFDGFLTYTTDPVNIPVPSGVVEMPMAFNVQPAPDGECSDGRCFVGRLDSGRALQYAGLPLAELRFESDPSGCASRPGDECLTFLDAFEADLTVGARYHTTSTDVLCKGDPNLRHARIPWLLEGFVGRSERDDESGLRYTYACLDIEAPLPGANPVPDGRLRYRNITLIDGAMINNDLIFLIFRENLETFLWESPNANNGIEGYGYMVLRKSEQELDEDDFEGLTVEQRDNTERFLRPVECTDTTLAKAGVTRQQLETQPAAHADRVARMIVDGITSDLSALDVVDPSVEAVHYLCEDTGLIDGGPRDNRFAGPVEQQPCPEGSRVTFFTLDLENDDAPLLDACGGLNTQDCHQAWIASEPCQQDGSCFAQLQSWIDNGRYGIRTNPYFRCQDPDRAFCNDDRHDLTEGKVFFAASPDVEVARPFLTDVGDAFRYRTRFVNRSGTNLGFVPEICIPGTDLVPYCYDPAAIEDLRTRVECGLELYMDHHTALSEDRRIALHGMLVEAFASAQEVNVFNQVTVRRGFEYLDAELMIMLGDEHYTRALSSRFDLARTRVSAFEGDLFEVDGINLSGVAGAEMHNLYKAIQYYQDVLDRFYDLSPLIAGSVKAEREQNRASFVTPEAVESYFGRLIRASTQKSRAWAEIAQRYQNFNRPDLSRRVIERAYTAGYLESMILTRLMQEIVDITAPEDIAQIQRQIETSQRNYRVALSVMRQHYANITDDINYFGFSPDFIPFPALEGLNDSSFEVARRRALDRIALAQTAEAQALEADLSFNTNAASFQNELARIENTYDAQLADICGTFDVDGQIYPATSRYAYLDDATRAVGDPCGLVGTGQINSAMSELDVLLTDVRRVRQSIANTQEEARIEEQRWNASCQVTDAFARLNFETSGQINTVQSVLDVTRTAIGTIDRFYQQTVTIAQMSKCSIILGLAAGGDCPTAGIAIAAAMGAYAIYEVGRTGLDLAINAGEAHIRELQRGVELQRDQLQCDLAAIDGQARVKTILLRVAEQELEALRVEYQVNQAVARIRQLRNEATRLQQEQAETEELAINIEAARNNPNVRIYRNDAILTADVTFYSALREVYKATKVFEYYTSQSYGPLEQLFLTRMVSRGDYNLQLYMIELEDAFRDFEDRYGLPSRRLQIISLKDDILDIPRIDVAGDGHALSAAERTALFREALTDPRRLDANGYLTVPFATSDESLSPLTRNHKIAHVEAEIIGGGQGDLLARVYLRMAGTSRVAPLGAEDPIFYTFPERLAVINPFFEGSKPLHIDADIYRNRNLFDRPLVNSRWEFVLNTLDEEVNQDLNLQGLDDVRLYVYYNDFTEF